MTLAIAATKRLKSKKKLKQMASTTKKARITKKYNIKEISKFSWPLVRICKHFTHYYKGGCKNKLAEELLFFFRLIQLRGKKTHYMMTITVYILGYLSLRYRIVI